MKFLLIVFEGINEEITLVTMNWKGQAARLGIVTFASYKLQLEIFRVELHLTTATWDDRWLTKTSIWRVW